MLYKPFLFSLLIAAFLPFQFFGQSAPIAIDAQFNDWTSNLQQIIDSPETISGIDLLEMQVSNDDDFLYIRIKTNSEFDLLDNLYPHDIRLHIDADNDASTGHLVQSGFGSELSINFQNRDAYFNKGQYSLVKLSSFSFRASPTITGNEFELAISRSAMPKDSNALFSSSSIKVLFENVANGDKLPNLGNDFIYIFDSSAVTPYNLVDLSKTDSTDIRVVVYNTLFNGLGDAARRPHFQSILQALNPDIIGFSETGSLSVSYLKIIMDLWLPLGTTDGWFVTKRTNASIMTASRWPISQEWQHLHRQFPVLIDLPALYPKDFLFTNAHLKCCSGDAIRQDQVDDYSSFISDAKKPGGIITLPNETPFVYGGDLNLVGYAQQLTTLLTGDIQDTAQYGVGALPDWDNSDLVYPLSLQSDIRMDYTWRDDGSSYPAGKLDYIIYSDAAISASKSFVLQTEVMSANRLQLFGLSQDNTSSASDHFPVVTDFSFSVLNSVSQSGMLNEHRLLPNPVSDYINIQFKSSDQYQVQILDAFGKVVYTTDQLSNQTKIDMSKYTTGLYLVRVTSEDGISEIFKIIKQ